MVRRNPRRSVRGPAPAPTPPRPSGPQYRPNDRAKRHRLPDSKRKTEVVVTHRRRKPAT